MSEAFETRYFLENIEKLITVLKSGTTLSSQEDCCKSICKDSCIYNLARKDNSWDEDIECFSVWEKLEKKHNQDGDGNYIFNCEYCCSHICPREHFDAISFGAGYNNKFCKMRKWIHLMQEVNLRDIGVKANFITFLEYLVTKNEIHKTFKTKLKLLCQRLFVFNKFEYSKRCLCNYIRNHSVDECCEKFRYVWINFNLGLLFYVRYRTARTDAKGNMARLLARIIEEELICKDDVIDFLGHL